MTIRRKLLLIIALILIFVALLGITSYRSLVTIRNRLRLVESMDDLGVSISDMRRGEKNYLLYQDAASATDWIAQVDLTRQAIQDKAAELTGLEGKDYCRHLTSDFSIYENLARRLIASPGSNLEADRVRVQGHKMYDYSRGIIHAERARIDTMTRSSYRVFVVSLLIVAIAGLAGVLIIMRDVVRPLAKIERATIQVSEGNYVPIPGIYAHDEIGKLQKAFNHMVQQIEKHQEELVQAGKLSSLGTLTSGVAHELNNPINNISMIAQTFVQHYDSLSEKERLEFMSQIDGQCERAKEIVDGLLDFSRVRPRTFTFADVGEVVRKSLKLVGNQLAVSKIECEFRTHERLPPVRMSAHRIEQVLVNIFTNAIKAMSGGGQLLVEASVGDKGRFVEIAITDTGAGIPPAILPHVFDPFFTTSQAGQGVGLGLSVSYGIIKRHGGTIAVKSDVGAGSTFSVRLPVVEREASDGGQTEDPDRG
jgi:two-component system NtrC family sensor kinase